VALAGRSTLKQGEGLAFQFLQAVTPDRGNRHDLETEESRLPAQGDQWVHILIVLLDCITFRRDDELGPLDQAHVPLLDFLPDGAQVSDRLGSARGIH
jgi:hypothetical protein